MFDVENICFSVMGKTVLDVEEILFLVNTDTKIGGIIMGFAPENEVEVVQQLTLIADRLNRVAVALEKIAKK